jgi:hypothetical protein
MTQQERDEKREAEIEYGRKITVRNMSVGLFETVRDEIIPSLRWRSYFTFYQETLDPADWQVVVRIPLGENDGITIVEDWSVFPSDELKTKIMLLA